MPHERFRQKQRLPKKVTLAMMRRSTRPTSRIVAFASRYSNLVKNGQVDRRVLRELMSAVISVTPYTLSLNGKKYFNSAHRTLSPKKLARDNTCVERCSLLIASLNLLGVKSWLARQLVLNIETGRWQIHDYVEANINGKVHTLFFGRNIETDADYAEFIQGNAEKVIPGAFAGFFLRGVDSMHIGGLKSMPKLKRFTRRIDSDSNLRAELQKNKRRLAMMVQEGLISEDFVRSLGGQIKGDFF